MSTEWNYDLSACPLHETVALLWPQREFANEDEDFASGEIVGYARLAGERTGADVADGANWFSGYLDGFPNADFWGDDHEYAQTPVAWHAIAEAPALPTKADAP